MSTPKIYGSKFSTCTQRVLLVSEEIGIPVDLIEIDMRAGQHKEPTYIAEKHPFAKIPAFEDGPTKFFESRAICRYLASKRSPDLLGSKSGLGLFEQAASVEYSYFDPPMKNLAYEKIFKRMMGHGEPDFNLVSNYEKQIRECLDYYESLLTKQKYLAGEAYTIVDAFHLPWIVFLEKLDMSKELEDRPHLLAWWKLVSERPAWKAVTSRLN